MNLLIRRNNIDGKWILTDLYTNQIVIAVSEDISPRFIPETDCNMLEPPKIRTFEIDFDTEGIIIYEVEQSLNWFIPDSVYDRLVAEAKGGE